MIKVTETWIRDYLVWHHPPKASNLSKRQKQYNGRPVTEQYSWPSEGEIVNQNLYILLTQSMSIIGQQHSALMG